MTSHYSRKIPFVSLLEQCSDTHKHSVRQGLDAKIEVWKQRWVNTSTRPKPRSKIIKKSTLFQPFIMNLSASPELLAYLDEFSTRHIENIITNEEWIREGEDPNHRPAGYTPDQIESVMAEYLPTRIPTETDMLWSWELKEIRTMLTKRFGCKCVAYETDEEFNYFWKIWRDQEELEKMFRIS